MNHSTCRSLREIPLSAEVREEDRYAGTGALEVEELRLLRAGTHQAAVSLLAIFGLRHFLAEGQSLNVDSKAGGKGLVF